MFRRILLLIVILCTSVIAEAQFAIGTRLGYVYQKGEATTTNIDNNAITINGSDGNGLNIGLLLRAGNRAFCQIECYYQYTQSSFANQDTSLIFKENYSVIDLPVFLGFKIVNKDFFNWYLLLGPKFRFSAGAKSTLDNIYYHSEPNKWQLGLSTGMGFDIGRVVLCGYYHLSPSLFKTTYDNGHDAPFVVHRTPFHSFTVALGFKFIDLHRGK